MKEEEAIVWEYLRKEYGENVIYEPYPNQTPDFQLNSTIAIEVRRLNQHFFGVEKAEGLEQVAYNTSKILNQILDQLNQKYQTKYPEKSFLVWFDYKRPFNFKMAKKEIKQALENFLELDVNQFPYHLVVNPQIHLTLDKDNISSGELFSNAGGSDDDEEVWIVSGYIRNISHCIQEKSEKITNDQAKYQQYQTWWLYLVDNMGGLPHRYWVEVVNSIQSKEKFHAVVILNGEGQKIIDF